MKHSLGVSVTESPAWPGWGGSRPVNVGSSTQGLASRTGQWDRERQCVPCFLLLHPLGYEQAAAHTDRPGPPGPPGQNTQTFLSVSRFWLGIWSVLRKGIKHTSNRLTLHGNHSATVHCPRDRQEGVNTWKKINRRGMWVGTAAQDCSPCALEAGAGQPGLQGQLQEGCICRCSYGTNECMSCRENAETITRVPALDTDSKGRAVASYLKSHTRIQQRTHRLHTPESACTDFSKQDKSKFNKWSKNDTWYESSSVARGCVVW